MRICLINPSILNDNEFNSPLSTRNKYFINPYTLQHIGIAYIASLLEEHGFEADLMECGYENLRIDDVSKRIKAGQYDVVGISAYFYNYTNVLRMVKKIRKNNPGIFLFLGGYLPTFVYDEVLLNMPEIDCCIIGEGEITALELMNNLREREDWRNIPGIASLIEGKVHFSGKRKLIANLDELPFPKRHFMSDRRLLPVLASRGCYGHCNYCGIYEFHKTCEGSLVRRRSPENVIQEIESLTQNYNVEYIMFNDGNFHISSKKGRNWFMTFYSLIKEKNINVRFLCDFRANEIVSSKDIIEKFIEIGLCNVNVGIESMIQSQLDFYEKTTTVEQNVKSLKTLEELGLRYTMGIMLFDPIVTVEGILETLQVFEQCKLYESKYNINRPVSIGSAVVATRGTPLYEFVIAEGMYAPNELNYQFRHEQTKLCYDIATDWSKIVVPLFNKNFLYYIAEDQQMDEEIKLIQSLYGELYYLDLQFMISLCQQILSGTIMQEADADILKHSCAAQVQILEARLEQLENRLLVFY